MFDENFEVKLVDFGTSKIVKNFNLETTYEGTKSIVGSTTTGMAGTFSHMAPEILVKRR